MRALVFRLLLFLGLYIVAGHLIKAVMPYYWGNPWWREKMKILDRSSSAHNVYFVGSSRTYRHIIPAVFDSSMAAHGVKTRSFNLGAPATFVPQSLFLLEQAIVHEDIPPGSMVFLEFDDIQSLEPDQLSSARNTYWITGPEIGFLTKAYYECGPRRPFRSFMLEYWYGFLTNTFHLSQYKGLVGEHETQYEELDAWNNAGFLSLTKEYHSYPNRRSDLGSRMNELRSDTSIIDRRRKASAEARSTHDGAACSALGKRLSALRRASIDRGVDLIFVLPPKAPSKNEWAAFMELPADQRIDMGDPGIHPEFYRLENLFDKGHLNEAGAAMYTRKLAMLVLASRPK
jgi:hypothetical protein